MRQHRTCKMARRRNVRVRPACAPHSRQISGDDLDSRDLSPYRYSRVCATMLAHAHRSAVRGAQQLHPTCSCARKGRNTQRVAFALILEQARVACLIHRRRCGLRVLPPPLPRSMPALVRGHRCLELRWHQHCCPSLAMGCMTGHGMHGSILVGRLAQPCSAFMAAMRAEIGGLPAIT